MKTDQILPLSQNLSWTWLEKKKEILKHNVNHNNCFNTASYWMGCIDLCSTKDMLTRGRPTGSSAIGKHILHWGTIIIPLRKIPITWHYWQLGIWKCLKIPVSLLVSQDQFELNWKNLVTVCKLYRYLVISCKFHWYLVTTC